jgi:hypothetical protein
MTPEKAQSILGRIDAAWPAKTSPTTAQYAEWIDFLQPYELEYAERALDELRAELQWRPSMAHFKHAYYVAAAAPEARPALPGETSDDCTYFDIYGSSQDDWVYCHLCDMAISLEERATAPIWRPGHGLQHACCPRRGTAPSMPPAERTARREWLSRVPE